MNLVQKVLTHRFISQCPDLFDPIRLIIFLAFNDAKILLIVRSDLFVSTAKSEEVNR